MSKVKWDSTLEAIKKDIKGFDLVRKQDKKLQKFLTKLLAIIKIDYMKFWTTIYPKVYSGIVEPSPRKWKTMQHEWVHLKDTKKFTFPLFVVIYYFPQIFALLAVLAFWSPWWLLCLLLAAPLPAPGRAWLELRAYRRSVELGQDKEHTLKAFTGSDYYFMFPFPKLMNKLLDKPSPYKKEMDKVIE